MYAISSHRPLEIKTKMRVLILTSLVACAIAAPSELHSVLTPVVHAVPIPAATVDPGDIQAAAINAKVALEDQTQLAADLARERSEIELEERKEKALEHENLAKEKNEEAFWNAEEKKWQAYEAVNTAAAKLDGAVASSAEALAKSALGGVIVPNYITPFHPIIAPFPAVAYAAPLLKTVELKDQRTEERKDDMRREEEKRGDNKREEEKREEERMEQMRREEERREEERRREEMRREEERREEERRREEMRREEERREQMRRQERPELAELVKTADTQRPEDRPQENKLEAKPLATFPAPLFIAPGVNPTLLQPVVYSYLPGQLSAPITAPIVAPTLIKHW